MKMQCEQTDIRKRPTKSINTKSKKTKQTQNNKQTKANNKNKVRKLSAHI